MTKGSITVEATLVFPLFFFVIIGFIYFFQVFKTEIKIQGNITEIAQEASRYGYLYDTLAHSGEEDSPKNQSNPNIKNILSKLVEGTYYKIRFRELNEEDNNLPGVSGGIDGVTFLGSSFMEEDGIIEVVASYRVKIPVPFFSNFTFPVIQQVKTRGFIGATLLKKEEDNGANQNNEDEYVYITESGQAYHSQKDCTYLKVKISCVSKDALRNLRNSSGAIYYPCEACTEGHGEQQSYYITEYGDRYHSSKLCNKIKHNILTIKKSEVGSRRPCSKCYK